MNSIEEKKAAAKAGEAERRAQADRLAQLAKAVLDTQDGRELLKHLCGRFGLVERVFLPAGERGEVNALRAAIRDGERAVLTYLIHLARKADGLKDFSPI